MPTQHEQEQNAQADNDDEAVDLGVVVDGRTWRPKNLTPRERRLMRITAGELAEAESGDKEDVGFDDYEVAILYVVLKKSNPDVSMDEVLDWGPVEEWSLLNGAAPDPTPAKPRRASKAS